KIRFWTVTSLERAEIFHNFITFKCHCLLFLMDFSANARICVYHNSDLGKSRVTVAAVALVFFIKE
ncbi:MAG: hypothetical protein ACI8P3_004228, partial [Saprospiraceae bacterium]